MRQVAVPDPMLFARTAVRLAWVQITLTVLAVIADLLLDVTPNSARSAATVTGVVLLLGAWPLWRYAEWLSQVAASQATPRQRDAVLAWFSFFRWVSLIGVVLMTLGLLTTLLNRESPGGWFPFSWRDVLAGLSGVVSVPFFMHSITWVQEQHAAQSGATDAALMAAVTRVRPWVRAMQITTLLLLPTAFPLEGGPWFSALTTVLMNVCLVLLLEFSLRFAETAARSGAPTGWPESAR